MREMSKLGNDGGQSCRNNDSNDLSSENACSIATDLSYLFIKEIDYNGDLARRYSLRNALSNRGRRSIGTRIGSSCIKKGRPPSSPCHSSFDDWIKKAIAPQKLSFDDSLVITEIESNNVKDIQNISGMSSGRMLICSSRDCNKNANTSSEKFLLPQDSSVSFNPDFPLESYGLSKSKNTEKATKKISDQGKNHSFQTLMKPKDPLDEIDLFRENIIFEEWDDSIETKQYSRKHASKRKPLPAMRKYDKINCQKSALHSCCAGNTLGDFEEDNCIQYKNSDNDTLREKKVNELRGKFTSSNNNNVCSSDFEIVEIPTDNSSHEEWIEFGKAKKHSLLRGTSNNRHSSYVGCGQWQGDSLQSSRESDASQERKVTNGVRKQEKLTSSQKEVKKTIYSSLHLNPVWKDHAVIQYCTKNYVMYILRGLPGSGKSTIAKQIKQFYSDDCAVICSIDDFRYNHAGKYEFDKDKSREIHRLNQEKAHEQCDRRKNVIIIDNTNLTLEEFNVYLKLAHQNDYIVNLIELDEFNVDICAGRNVHQVHKETISIMKSKFEEVIGYFYGWCISVEGTFNLRCIARQSIQAHANIHAFKTFMYQQKISKLENLFNKYHMKSSTCSVNLCHVTSFYSNCGERLGSKKYIDSKLVMENVGRVDTLQIIGLCITPKCLFARVLLSEKQKGLWGDDDSLNGEVNELYSECCSNKDVVNLENNGDLSHQFSSMNLNIPKITSFFGNMRKDYLLPDFGVGCTAHITLGVCDAYKPVSSKEGLRTILSLELEEKPRVEYALPNNLLRCYRRDYWVIYFKDAVFIPAMFSGTYYSRKLQ